MPKLIQPQKVNLLNNKEISESMIQEMIADNPSIIGLGDLVLKDKERIQPKAGRLDLLLQDIESSRRYEVEIQLGKTDESHIIRTIEYWDIERKRYPQYDHCAVIIAEDITSRFLNIISLFNGHLPIIAIQVNAYKYNDDVAMVFTKVLDELPLGLLDDDEEVREVTDRSYWIKKGSEKTVVMADQILDMVNTFSSGYELNYNKFYIGMAMNGRASNFIVVRPRKKHLQIDIKLPQLQEHNESFFEENDLDDMGYDNRYGNYRIRLTPDELSTKRTFITEMIEKAHANFL